GRAREADAAAPARLPERLGGVHRGRSAIARKLVAPARGLHDLVDALAQPDRCDRQMVRRFRERPDRVTGYAGGPVPPSPARQRWRAAPRARGAAAGWGGRAWVRTAGCW